MDGLQQLTLDSLKTPDGVNQVNRILQALYDNVAGDGEGVRVFTGIGSPEGVVTAGIGSLYLRTDGSSGTSFYKKTSGTDNTGWEADSNLTLPLSVANGGTGADNSAALQGVIPYFSATGVISGLATGTSGQFLKTQGASANPAWATVGEVSTYIDGAYIESTAATSRNIANDSFTKIKELTPLTRSGTISTSYAAQNNSASVEVRLYKNGVAFGTQNTQNAVGFATYTDTGLSVTKGDVLQVYTKRSVPGNGASTDVKDFKILCGNPIVAQEASGL